jgi:hypothetical protein
MKALAVAASAVLLVASISVASAQSQAPVAPSNINKGAGAPGERVSGSQPEMTANPKMHVVKKKTAKVKGKKKNVAVSPANINKGTGQETEGARTSGSQPNSTAK